MGEAQETWRQPRKPREMVRAFRHAGAARAFAVFAMLLCLGTVAGLVLLWPDGSRDEHKVAPPLVTHKAEVIRLSAIPCQVPGETDCAQVEARIQDGPRAGQLARLRLGDSRAHPDVKLGENIRVVRNAPPGGNPTAQQGDPYNFSDFDRRAPMLWLAVGFAGIVLLFGRLRGAMSLLGLGLSLTVVVAFIVPAILDGAPPLAVAVVGSMGVMLSTILLSHGTGPKSLAAILGTAGSLAITLGLAVAFTHLIKITGLSSEEALLLQVNDADISLQGLVLAGMVIGALGVLDDVTVSQASAVMALRRANPLQAAGELYRGALDVGRDHVAATVNTLVLAYVGASLPILLIFTVGNTGFPDAISKEAVAIQVVATLVGSIGLIAAVPITTAIAALLASRLSPGEMGDVHAGHAH